MESLLCRRLRDFYTVPVTLLGADRLDWIPPNMRIVNGVQRKEYILMLQ